MCAGRSNWIGWRQGITGDLGVAGENDNKRRIVEFCGAVCG